MKLTMRQLRRVIRESIGAMTGGTIQVYDAEWEQVSGPTEAIEWAKDKLENDYYGRPDVINFEGNPSQYAYLDRYAAEVSSAGPTIVYCLTEEECENRYHDALADI